MPQMNARARSLDLGSRKAFEHSASRRSRRSREHSR
jgi:hypothetical protein